MSKKRRSLKAERDAKQRMLAPEKTVGIKEREVPLPEWVKHVTGDILCPFCLRKAKPVEFLILTSWGYHSGRAKCPECGNIMLIDSLTARWTPEEFAEWVYEYPNYQFWKKCSYNKFTDRLKRLGWSYAFWGKYKQLKEPSVEEQLRQYQADWGKEYIKE